MEQVWHSIKSKLKIIAPQILEGLNKGVSDDGVQKLEKLIIAKLPESFIDFYKVHNGQTEDSPGLIGAEELLSFERITIEWKRWKSLLDDKHFEDEHGSYKSRPGLGIKNNWWNPLWLPITYDGHGNHYCLDLDPNSGGTYGQIIRMWHDEVERSLEATSFKKWITNYKNDLLADKFMYSEDYGGIVEYYESGDKKTSKNLLDITNLPIGNEEVFEMLVEQDNVLIERIVSMGQVTPEGEWYEQAKNEWVVVLQGEATLLYENNKQIDLRTGDYLLIPSMVKHRVIYTSDAPACIWLAIHF